MLKSVLNCRPTAPSLVIFTAVILRGLLLLLYGARRRVGLPARGGGRLHGVLPATRSFAAGSNRYGVM